MTLDASTIMLKEMQKGAVIVDVGIDQGGMLETSRPTTHSDPIFEVEGVIHYCVANMPGAVARTSTVALTNATLPYAVEIANKGWKKAMQGEGELDIQRLSSWGYRWAIVDGRVSKTLRMKAKEEVFGISSLVSECSSFEVYALPEVPIQKNPVHPLQKK